MPICSQNYSHLQPQVIAELIPVSTVLTIYLLPIWIFHVHEIIHYGAFCVWLPSLSMFFGSSVLLPVSVLHSFVLLSSISWQGHQNLLHLVSHG